MRYFETRFSHLLFLLCLFYAKPSFATSWPQQIIAYYPGYNGNANIKSVPWNLISQINVAFAGIDPNGTCGWFDPNGDASANANNLVSAISALKSARAASINPNAKIVLSVGGQYASGFSRAVTNTVSYTAQSCVDLMNRYGLDGLDYDWEYPGYFNGKCPAAMAPCSNKTTDPNNFTQLLATTKNLLDGKILSAALYVATSPYYVIYDYAGLNNLTQANLMAYDMAFPSDTPPANLTGYNANFATARASLSYFVSKGVAKNKLVLGVPFYSYRWSGVASPGALGSSGNSTDSTQFSYARVKQMWGSDPNCSLHNDPNGSYYFCSASSSYPNDWVSFDPPSLMATKGTYVTENGYGGLMIWLMGQDDNSNSLSRAARAGLSIELIQGILD